MRDRFPTQINLAVPGFVDQDLSPRGMSHSAQYCQRKWAILIWCLKRAATRQTRRPALLRLVSRHGTPTIERSREGRPEPQSRRPAGEEDAGCTRKI
jgi:hypothetical protein